MVWPADSLEIASVTEAGSFSEEPLPVPVGEQKMSPATGTSGVVGVVFLVVAVVRAVAVVSLDTLTVVVTVVVLVSSVVTTGSVVRSVKPLPIATIEDL